MRKLAIASMLAMPFASMAYAQEVEELWVARYHAGMSNFDGDHASAIVLSPDGSRLFVTGASGGSGTADRDYATLAYDPATGEEIWEARYDGACGCADQATGIAVSPDGSQVYVTGASVGQGTSLDYLTIAYDADSGDELWVSRFDGPASDLDHPQRAGIIAASGDTVLVTGYSIAVDTVEDYATVAYDANTGVELWVARYDGPASGPDRGLAIALSPDGSTAVVTGYSYGVDTESDIATIAYDTSSGAELWVSRHNGLTNDRDNGIALVVSPDGGRVLVTGHDRSEEGDFPGDQSVMDYVTLAYDLTTGAELWRTHYDGPASGTDNPRGIAASPDGDKVFVTGYSDGGVGETGWDCATIAYDSGTGDPLWEARYHGGNANDICYAITAVGDRVLVTGETLGAAKPPFPGTPDYITVGYDAASGEELWTAQYNGPADRWDLAFAIAALQDATGYRVFVTGESFDFDTRYDYATVAYLEPVSGAVELAFDPASLAFGDVEVGTTSPPQIATLTNTGDADATGVAFSGLPDGGFAADSSTCGDVLPAGESCPVSVTFTPAAPGPATGTLHVASDEGAAADLALSGNGIGGGGPIAEITPASFSFAVPPGGGDSGTLTIGNLGDVDLDWSLDEAESNFVREGAPYRYGLAEMPAFRAPVGYDRAAGRVALVRSAPATPIVLPAPQSQAIGELAEGFDDITQLPGAGWALINNSEPVGPSSWFQGNPTIFPAHEGAPDAYIAANFESTDDVGTISNWLITPEVTIVNGTTITFWTRKAELFGEFADRMEVRMSIAGDSTDVGDTAESVGAFTEVLLTINPDLIPGEYPQEWTQFTLTVRERSREPVTGRFAFRYWVTDAGPDGTNADYIGIDTVSVTQPDGEPPGGGCDNPLDIPWLAADPTSGTTAPGASEPVTVSVDATDLEVGEHTAQLCVTTNDPAAPLVEIPVQLTVTGIGRVSVASDGSEGNDHSFVPALSADGRQVVFDSLATNLVPGDGNGVRDVFVHDRAGATTARVSVASDGSEANGDSSFPSVSADGRYVAFQSGATNLVPDDANGASDIFVHDRETATTERVSVASDGGEGDDASFSSPFPAISADGRYVVFESVASNLVADDTNGARDVFVRDRVAGTTERVSVASDGGEGNDTSWVAVISADGRYVAFQSFAANLVAGDANETADIFVHDRDTGITIRVSVASDGTEANGRSLVPAISADGGQVAFDSLASNLVPDDTNGALDIFVHDLDTGITDRLSVASDGTEGNADSPFPAISADGRRVAFASVASNLVTDDTNATLDIFVHDRETGTTERVSVAADGSEADGLSLFPAISADGHHVAFESVAANLVPDDTNGMRDVFVRSGLLADAVCSRGRRTDAEEGCDAGTEAAAN